MSWALRQTEDDSAGIYNDVRIPTSRSGRRDPGTALAPRLP